MKHLIHDEYHFMFKPERFIEELRSVTGVPGEKYRVEGERVYLFDKLLALVEKVELPFDGSSRKAALEQAALRLLPDAYVSGEEAVKQWNIKPKGYTIEQAEGGFVVWNEIIHSYIPVTVAHVTEAQNLLALVLLGKIIPTDYDAEALNFSARPLTAEAGTESTREGLCGRAFSFFGQTFCFNKNGKNPFRLDEILLLNYFPYSSEESDSRDVHPEWKDGFPLITKPEFTHLSHLAGEWDACSLKMEELITPEQAAEFLTSLDLTQPFAPVGWETEADDEPLLTSIRLHYPEADSMAGADLFYAYTSFMSLVNSCRTLNVEDVYRNDQFLLYLVGQLSLSQLATPGESYDLVNAGRAAILFSLQGMSWEESKAKAQEFIKINFSVFDAIFSSRNVFSYIDIITEQGGKLTSGQKVLTSSDFFKMARKHSGLVQVSQEMPHTSQLIDTGDKPTLH